MRVLAALQGTRYTPTLRGEVLVNISQKPPRSHNRSMPRSVLELGNATLL